MEQAARQRKTPGEIMNDKENRDSVNTNLVRALLDAGNPFETVRFTYQSFKEEYGFKVFGNMQPKRALDAVADTMAARGYEIQAGIMVKENGNPAKGFAIYSME